MNYENLLKSQQKLYIPRIRFQEPDIFTMSYYVPRENRRIVCWRLGSELKGDIYVETIKKVFKITNTELTRYALKKNKGGAMKLKIREKNEIDLGVAKYNVDWSVKKGKELHSLRYFDIFKENYLVLHPHTKGLLKIYNSLINSE